MVHDTKEGQTNFCSQCEWISRQLEALKRENAAIAEDKEILEGELSAARETVVLANTDRNCWAATAKALQADYNKLDAERRALREENERLQATVVELSWDGALNRAEEKIASLREKALELVQGIREARVEFLAENSDGEVDCVTPYDKYLYDLGAITK